ncbi:AAA family ATPase [Deinococcus peraridilitoris]|uniref:MoxR-like ATPase n=1 Tax=Deinococcus peraridilitoris (strain DSM 19664 / LMG 22246 / CIP 109416 / KR-200) TaxID=937777 RepID=L0A804_DEIPD|nr:AAA family ATPase [Deinococcus peraridilitoris]AFZ69175.1 MoxR-like ATPase [Deinococcus peraridilitoris DSM 19664]
MTNDARLTPLSPQAVTDASARLRTLLFEVKKVIVGQDLMLERLLVALLSRGHVLVEGVPGLAKTLAIKSTADAIGASFRRIQFTPDLVPADLIGTRIYNQKNGNFEVELGPVFAHLILADEINRAPAKIQSALLEAMQERQATIGLESYALPEPFLVLATQNPIESEGTYFLPEAQVDRFMFKVVVGYPGFHEEMTVVERVSQKFERIQVQLSLDELRELQAMADVVYVHPSVIEYAVKLARATRDPGEVGLGELKRAITYGASPRASVNLILGAKALAIVRGREYALPEDVRDLAPEVLRHRIMLSYEGLAEEVQLEDLIGRIIGAVPLPRMHLGDPHGSAGYSPTRHETA